MVCLRKVFLSARRVKNVTVVKTEINIYKMTLIHSESHTTNKEFVVEAFSQATPIVSDRACD